MKVYRSKYNKLAGTSYKEAERAARKYHRLIQNKSPRRQAYVRATYFNKDKVFVDQFWVHLKQKYHSQRLERVKLYSAAIDLIQNSRIAPSQKINPNKTGEILHRFLGCTRDGQYFYVQIRSSPKTGRKDFMSAFPANKKGLPLG